jgi:hypothetical protein
MPEILTIPKAYLENALKLAILSTEATDNIITGHCLFNFKFQERELIILATDKKNRLSMSKMSSLEVSGTAERDTEFTADPRKLFKLLKTIEGDSVDLSYDQATNTLQIFLSSDKESFISLPSFDPNTYALIADIFQKAYDLKIVNAGVFLGGMQFIKGFLDLKDQKFSNMYITKGVMYGSNGSNKAAAFSSPDLADLNELVFPLSTFPAITNLIEDLDLQDILIGTSSNHIFISSPSKSFVFAFTKMQIKMPKIPITIDEPAMDGWKINKKILLKKLGRLHLSGDSKTAIKCQFTEDKLQLSTVADRPSKDSMGCLKIKDTKEGNCITECRLLEATLLQFGGEELSFYLKNKIIIYDQAELEFMVKEEKIKKPFTSAAAVSLSREE